MDYRILSLLFRYGKEYGHQRVREQGISDTECTICSSLYAHEGCSQDEVAAALGIDKTTAGKALMSLEKKGCVIREQADFDRRFKQLHLTDLGRQKIDRLMHLHDEWLSDAMSCLTEQEQRQFEDYCGRILKTAQEIEPLTESESKKK